MIAPVEFNHSLAVDHLFCFVCLFIFIFGSGGSASPIVVDRLLIAKRVKLWGCSCLPLGLGGS